MRRQECLDNETVADYLEGRLQGQTRDRIETHFSKCSQCLETLVVTHQVYRVGSNEYVKAVPPAVTQRPVSEIDRIETGGWLDLLMSRFKAWTLGWSRLLNRFSFPLTRALVSVRCNKIRPADDIIMCSKSFAGLDAEIELERLDSRQANVKVSVSGAMVENFQVRISLLRNEREIASYLVDRESVYFESIPFGRYTLAFTQNGTNIGQFDFNIRMADDGGRNV